MGLKQYDRYSAAVIRSPRWKFVRLAAKRRDGFKCVQCPSNVLLEVDHIKPVRTNPELAFELSNLQTLCKSCHSAKTKIECGFGNEVSPARAAWRDLVATMAKPQPKETLCCTL
ncbi:HNH endonuclease [Bradyrhizobium sp. LA6.7]|uniref:HNH endonuclease n=1 Tax=unclassified Bradyrhizobium TaxID=2631580 RepID=UPI00339A58B0